MRMRLVRAAAAAASVLCVLILSTPVQAEVRTGLRCGPHTNGSPSDHLTLDLGQDHRLASFPVQGPVTGMERFPNT